MKDHALRVIDSQSSSRGKLNVLREYLQAVLLRELHAKKFFESAVFIGGTALRFLHQLPRYSEDLDFTLSAKSAPLWVDLLKKLKSDLEGQGYAVQISYRDKAPVFSASIKFSNLLYESGLSAHKNQILSIKLELDVNPPSGAGFESQVITLHFPLALLTHDLPTLFAGKIHAILARGFTKGRDFFDIGFYRSKWNNLEPNLLFLKNALQQTGWKIDRLEQFSWKHELKRSIEKADWKKVNQDMENFLERPSDRLIMSQENLLALLKD